MGHSYMQVNCELGQQVEAANHFANLGWRLVSALSLMEAAPRFDRRGLIVTEGTRPVVGLIFERQAVCLVGTWVSPGVGEPQVEATSPPQDDSMSCNRCKVTA